MRVRLKGLNKVAKKLADGSSVTYFYAWKGGPRLQGEPGTPEFLASYHAALSSKREPPRGVLLSLMAGYQASEDFRSRSDHPTILATMKGRAWTADGFHASWKKACTAAGIKGVTLQRSSRHRRHAPCHGRMYGSRDCDDHRPRLA